jgi:ammonia channel protein AmtB
MTSPPITLDGLTTAADVLFLLMGAILVFAMHGGFAFLEVGTVRHKNQVNALVKIIVDFAISTVAYFFVGFSIAYGIMFLLPAEAINGSARGYDGQGLTLVRFFFLATFAAAVPAIVSGGIAERVRFWPQCLATALIVGLFYPTLAKIFMILPARLWSTLSAVGLLWPRSDKSVRALVVTAAANPTRRHPPRSCGWPSARGCCASAGSASTS